MQEAVAMIIHLHNVLRKSREAVAVQVKHKAVITAFASTGDCLVMGLQQ